MDPEELKKLAESTAALVGAQVDAKLAAVAEKAKADAETAAKAAALEIFEQARASRSEVPPPGAVREATPAKHDPRVAVIVGKHATEGTGINFARLVKARAVAQMEGRSVVAVLKGWGDEVVHRALSQSDFGGMGSTIHPEFAAEFIEFLRAKAVVRRAGARQIPMGASLIFDRQTATGSAGYGDSVDAIPASDGPKTGQLVMSEKKLRALVAVPNDIIRNASIAAEEFVRDDIVKLMALTEDEAFLFGSGVQFEPLGLLGALDANGKLIGDGQALNVYAETINTAFSPTLEEMKAEVNKAKKTLKKANAPMITPVWLMCPDTEAGILNAVGPGGEGYNSLEREMVSNGTIGGFPYFVSNQIPTNIDTSSKRTRFGLIDMSEVIIGDSLAMEVEVFPNGTYSAGGQVVSGISTDRTVVRAIAKHDIGFRHNVSAAIVKNSSWGLSA